MEPESENEERVRGRRPRLAQIMHCQKQLLPPALARDRTLHVVVFGSSQVARGLRPALQTGVISSRPWLLLGESESDSALQHEIMLTARSRPLGGFAALDCCCCCCRCRQYESLISSIVFAGDRVFPQLH